MHESADHAGRELGERGADAVIETVGGRARTVTDAVRLVRPGGIVCMLGVFEGDTALPALDFSLKEVSLVGSNCYARVGASSDFAAAVGLLRARLTAARSLVTHRFALERVNEAFATAADKSTGSIKVTLTP